MSDFTFAIVEIFYDGLSVRWRDVFSCLSFRVGVIRNTSLHISENMGVHLFAIEIFSPLEFKYAFTDLVSILL